MKIIRLLLLLQIIFFNTVKTAAAEDPGNGVFSFPETYRNIDDIPISKNAENTTNTLVVYTGHEWMQMIYESGLDFNMNAVYTVSLTSNGSPLSFETTLYTISLSDSGPKKETVSVGEDGILTVELPINAYFWLDLPVGTEYTVTADYPFADLLYYSNLAPNDDGDYNRDCISGTIHEEAASMTGIFYQMSTMPSLNVTATYESYGRYDLTRHPYANISSDIDQSGFGYIPILVTDPDGNQKVIRGWTSEGKLSAELEWDTTVTIPLPSGTSYTLSTNFPYADISIEGEEEGITEISGTLVKDSVDVKIICTIRLLTLYYTKYVTGPYNGEEFTLYLGLATATWGDDFTVAPICTLNGEEIEFTRATENLDWRDWEIEIPIRGGETAVIENIPYGVYYYYSEIHNNNLENYITIWGTEEQYDGSSGYFVFGSHVDEDLTAELAMTNRRFNYSYLYITKQVEGDIPEDEEDREFQYTITFWDESADGEKYPITGEFPYVVYRADEMEQRKEVLREGTLVLDESGQGTFTLKANESIRINSLYSGTYYQVAEEDLWDYQESSGIQPYKLIEITEGHITHSEWRPDGTVELQPGVEQSGKINRVDNTEVLYNNRYDPQPTPTPTKTPEHGGSDATQTPWFHPGSTSTPGPNWQETPKAPGSPELPATGFSSTRPQTLSEQPADIRYRVSGLTLMIPSLDLSTGILEVPSVDGEYPITWLGNNVGLLEGSAIPGEGRSLLTGHNTLNTTEFGPFAGLSSLEVGDRIFVSKSDGDLLSYAVYANEKIAADDFDGLDRIAPEEDNVLVLITCEDELPNGGYVNRRIIAAGK